MNQIMIPDVDAKALAGEINPIVEAAKSLVVRTQQDDEQAQRGLIACAKAEKFIQSVYRAPKAVLDRAHADMCAAERVWLDPIKEARKLYFSKHDTYAMEQARIAAAKAAELAAIAQKQEEDRRLQDAALAEAAGDHEAAEAIVSEPILPIKVDVPVAVTKVEGVGNSRKTWDVEVTSLPALIKCVAAKMETDPGLAACLDPSMSTLRSLAKAKGGQLGLDGVRAFQKPSSNVRV